MQLEIRAQREDIERYITGNIAQLPSFVYADVQLQEDIKHQIVTKADGM